MKFRKSMKFAGSQPYFFPYIGYFQIIKAADLFVFGDNYNFIKNGWINRNRILVHGEDSLFTVPCNKQSSFKLINEIEFNPNDPKYRKLSKTIEHAYSNAPYFNQVFPVIEDVLSLKTNKISDLAIESVRCVSEYLQLDTPLLVASESFPKIAEMDRLERILTLCKENKANHFINPIGGKDLYKKEFFKKEGIQLDFLKSEVAPYTQFNNSFISNLSIIDVMMFNSIEEINIRLDQYTLV